jgi:hypothetical protein
VNFGQLLRHHRSASGADHFSLPSGPAYFACRERLAEILDTALAPEEIERLKSEGRSFSIDAAMAEAQQV